MEEVIQLILRAGQSTVDVALYTFLPIMVVMMILMRFLEIYGVLEKIIKVLSPLLKPFGLSGLAVLAIIQISLVSFVAPLPTLALMEDRGVSDRNLAAGTAAILAMAPANVIFPLAAYGVNVGENILISIIGGLISASCCYYIFGRKMSNHSVMPTEIEKAATINPSFLKTIEISGTEAINIVLRIIPMLMISLLLVYALQDLGFVKFLSNEFAPIFSKFGLSSDIIFPALTKYLAGGTALVALYQHLGQGGTVSPALISGGAMGFLAHPLDIAGVGILLSAGHRIARGAVPALAAAIVGIAVRTVLGALL